MLEVTVHRVGHRGSGKGSPLGQGEVEDAPQRIEIGTLVERLHLDLLWGDVVDRTEERAGLVERLERGCLTEFGEAEVQQFHLKPARRLPGHHDVARLEVAVEEIELLRGDERIERLIDEFEKVGDGKGALLRDDFERVAANQFEDDVGPLIIDAKLIDRDHILMLEAGKGACLAGKRLGRGGIVELRIIDGEESLDRDTALEAQVKCLVNGANATPADPAFYFVAVRHGR